MGGADRFVHAHECLGGRESGVEFWDWRVEVGIGGLKLAFW